MVLVDLIVFNEARSGQGLQRSNVPVRYRTRSVDFVVLTTLNPLQIYVKSTLNPLPKAHSSLFLSCLSNKFMGMKNFTYFSTSILTVFLHLHQPQCKNAFYYFLDYS